MLPLPALSLPRMGRRVMGALYGSARPDRDFLVILDRTGEDVYRSAGWSRGGYLSTRQRAIEMLSGTSPPTVVNLAGDDVTQRFVMRIVSVETRSYRHPLDPPFRAAWDPVPRDAQEATLVIVTADDGSTGFASGGDGLPDRALLERLLGGVDPRDNDTVQGVCETVDFHGGRPWAVEIACWDLAARAAGRPLWELLGGSPRRLVAYASTGELAEPDERARRAAVLRDRGLRALKLRFHHPDWRDDVRVVEAVRTAVGPDMEIMVDANQGWRMPGDLSPRWSLEVARACAERLRPLRVHWLEEPLPTEDVAGYADLAGSAGIPSRPARWCEASTRRSTCSSAAAST